METWFTAFPDMHIRSVNRVVSEDAVAGELEFTGTNTGPLVVGGMQMPATGKSVKGTGSYFASVRDGKIASFSAHPDVAGMMVQLGTLPGMDR
jgi:predicted ester cyclase